MCSKAKISPKTCFAISAALFNCKGGFILFYLRLGGPAHFVPRFHFKAPVKPVGARHMLDFSVSDCCKFIMRMGSHLTFAELKGCTHITSTFNNANH